MAQIIDGKAVAQRIREELKQEVARLASVGVQPGLAVVLVGDDPASAIYVKNKTKACKQLGIAHFDHRLPGQTTQPDLLALVATLNRDPRVHGILVQLPLPAGLDAEEVIRAIDPAKDVDGFHPANVGQLVVGDPGFVPCTPLGILRLLREVETPLVGAHAVVVGRSNIVGKPTALLLLREHCTVTLCHSRTRDLPGVISRGEIVVAAVGRPELVRGDWIREGATVIDVGMNRLEERLVGDVEFARAAERARALTPVPGGVGPMTIAMLMQNTVLAARRRAPGQPPSR